MRRINFRDRSVPFHAENVGLALNDLYDAIDKIQSGQTITNVINSAISSAVSGGSASKIEYRTGTASVSSGPVTITFSSAMTTTNFLVIAYLIDSDGATTLLKSPTSKTLTGFSYTFDWAATIVYFAIANQ